MVIEAVLAVLIPVGALGYVVVSRIKKLEQKIKGIEQVVNIKK